MADPGQPAPASDSGTAGGQQPEAGTAPGPDPVLTAEDAGNVLAIAQATGEAGKALATGNLDVALAALDTARDLAAQGRRVLKAAASGRRGPATRPGALRDLVEEHLRKFPAPPSPRTRSARYSPGRPARSPTPSTSSSASAPRRWSPTSPAPTSSPPPPPPRTRRAPRHQRAEATASAA